MSHLASKEFLPKYFTKFITLSIPSYFTTEFSKGINELTELPVFLGKDKSCIRLNLPGTFFGTNPSGEQTKFSKGGERNGPAIRPFRDSFANFSYTLSLFSVADL